jgi:alpha/beta superfamily hydrolase
MNAYDFDFLVENRKPSLYIVGADDEHCPKEKLASLAPRLPQSSEVQVIEGADHFFSLHLGQVQSMISEFFMKLSFQ